MVWVSTTTHPSLPLTLPMPSPGSFKNLLHFYEKQGGLGGVRRVGGPKMIRKTRGAREAKGTRETRKTRWLGRLRKLERLGRLGRLGG